MVANLGVDLNHEARALLAHAARISDGTVGARRLWESLAVVSEREWIRLVGATGLPEFDEATESACIEVAGVRLDRTAGVALELAGFLADHYASGRVEVGHVAIALAGNRPAGGSLAGMVAAADAFLGAELVDLEDVIRAYVHQPDGGEPAAPRRLPSGRLNPKAWRLRRAWRSGLIEFISLADSGDYAGALARADDLIRIVEDISVKADDVVVLCEASANSAFQLGQWKVAGHWAARGLTVASELSQPLSLIKQASLCAFRAGLAIQTSDPATADELVERARAALVSAAASEVQLPGFAQSSLDDLADEVSLRLATCLVMLGRLDAAIDTLATTIGRAEVRGSNGKMFVGLAMAASLFVQIGDVDRAAALVAQIEDRFEGQTSVLGLSSEAVIAFITMIGYAGAECCAYAGNPDGARDSLVRAIEEVEGAQVSAQQQGSLISLYAKLAEHYLDAGQHNAATELLNRLEPGKIIGRSANSDLLEVTTRWFDLVNPEAKKALLLVQTYEQIHGRDSLPPDSQVKVFPSAAAGAAADGELAVALNYVERAAAAMAVLSGGRLPAWRRSTLFTSQERPRDRCLEVAAAASVVDPDRAGILALQVADVWRESTLASLLTHRPGNLTGRLREVFDEIEKLTHASGNLGASDSSTRGDSMAYAHRFAELQTEVAARIGSAFAGLVVPTRELPALRSAKEHEALLSITPLRADEELKVCAAWLLPDGRSGVQVHALGNDAARFVGVLGKELPSVFAGQLNGWLRAWTAAVEDLSLAILPASLREWIAAAHRPTIRYAVDGELAELPIAALSLSDHLLVDVAAVNRVPFLRPFMPSASAARSGPPRVLAYLHDASNSEKNELARLAAAGRISLDVVAHLPDVLSSLSGMPYDVLTLSCHGEGTGLGFHFRNDDAGAERLYTHQLLAAQIPPLVIAASCYSGRGGAVDVTGLVATLLTRGASAVVSGSWAIPERESSELLTAFYELLDGTGTVAQRLRAAVIASGLTQQNPYVWGGLVCTEI